MEDEVHVGVVHHKIGVISLLAANTHGNSLEFHLGIYHREECASRYSKLWTRSIASRCQKDTRTRSFDPQHVVAKYQVM